MMKKGREISVNRQFEVRVDEKLCEKYYFFEHESGLSIYVFPKKMTLKTLYLVNFALAVLT